MTRTISRSARSKGTLRISRTLIAAAVTVFSATTLLTWLSPAEAIPRAVRRACKYDYKKLCGQYRMGSSKANSCMRSSVGGITPRCYDKLVQYGYGGKRAKKRRRRRRR
ncbi:MAG: hypothetical protein ACR2PA_02095 [Hyphomicrobiaceae bacterium]